MLTLFDGLVVMMESGATRDDAAPSAAVAHANITTYIKICKYSRIFTNIKTAKMTVITKITGTVRCYSLHYSNSAHVSVRLLFKVSSSQLNIYEQQRVFTNINR